MKETYISLKRTNPVGMGVKQVDKWLSTQCNKDSSEVDSTDEEVLFKRDTPFLNIPRCNTEAHNIA